MAQRVLTGAGIGETAPFMSEDRIAEALSETPEARAVAVAVVEMPMMEMVFNEAFAGVIGLNPSTPRPMLTDLIVPADWPVVEAILRGVASGLIESCQTRGRLRKPCGGEVQVVTWVRPYDGGRPCRRALLAVAPADAAPPVPDPLLASVDARRLARLEDHLRRIAIEVQVADVGALPSAGRSELARLDALSERQSEIVRRLMDGERVPAIAAALFLSQNTVRNHLSAVYRKFGVHSQSELLAHLLGGRARRDA